MCWNGCSSGKDCRLCTSLTDKDGQIESETRTFGTMTKNLFELLKWLETKSVSHVAMESTGIYWKPVYNIFEGYFEVSVANAHRIKNCPRTKNGCV